MTAVLLVDAHPVLRAGLAGLVRDMRRGVHVVQAGTLAEASARLREAGAFDLCLTDRWLPDGDGLEWLGRRGDFVGGGARGLLAADVSPALVDAARSVGCRVCLSKASALTTLREALVVALDGGAVYAGAPAAAARSRQGAPTPFLPLTPRPQGAPRLVVLPAAAGAVGEPAPLSTRRLQVLRLAAEGFSNKDIARTLDVGERTVKDHLQCIFDRLGVANRAQAVSTAHRLGWL